MGIWRQISKELVQKFRIFNVFNVGFESVKTGKAGLFNVLELKDWVNVLPITDSGEAIMVRQFRYGVNDLTLEFPAGVIEEGQTPAAAAARELLEETGSNSPGLRELGSCHPNPAFQNNRCFFFLAQGAKQDQEQSLDEFEEIEIVKVPILEIDRMIAAGDITHAMTIANWYFYRAANPLYTIVLH
jgi:ADP-ribose pyrophosphatase